jgi:N-(2-amino-2-carboxyethyl)-L-glutamate synthase
MDQRVYQGILATVGDTPLVRLHNLDADSGAQVFAKLERFNPTGSIEDRAALSELMAPIRSGDLIPGGCVVARPQAANLAVSLAQVCRYFSFELHVVLGADQVTSWHRAMLEAYGARLEVVEPEAAAVRAEQLAAELPGAYRIDAEGRPGNDIRGWPRPEGDLLGEIRGALPTEPEYVFCPTSSMTALRSCIAHVRAYRLAARIVAVDDARVAEHDPALSLRLGAEDSVLAVREADAVAGCRHLLVREGILAGSSSGAVVAALARMRGRIPADALCVLVLPDGADRYLDTVYCDPRSDGELAAATGLWTRNPIDEGESAPC